MPRRTPTASARHYYDNLFTPDERARLGEAAQDVDLTGEIELLRVLVARAIHDDEPIENVTRAVARLGQLLRVQHVLSGDAARGLDEALAKVLEEISMELVS